MSNPIAAKYVAVLKSKGGLWQTIRQYGVLRMIDAGLHDVWTSFGMGMLRVLGRQPGQEYGWLEAILFPDCAYWLRYTRVLKGLEGNVGAVRRLVEVASGRGGVGWVFRKPDLETCLVDRSPELLRDGRGGNSWRVCADASRLPFLDGAFDAAISLDTVEHLPKDLRAPFLGELRRVVKCGVVLTCPLQSSDGEYQGRDLDMLLQADIVSRRGVQPGWLQEHIQRGHPTLDELREQLPDVRVEGEESCSTWTRFALLAQRPFFWPVAGIYYMLFIKNRENRKRVPPFRRAVLAWKKSATSATEEKSVPSEGTALHPGPRISQEAE
jgi:ubiquinone/menaquinone biosynthesis C-methylase UbiE